MKILFVVSHPDDLEFSCGGLLAKLVEKQKCDDYVWGLQEPCADPPDEIKIHVFSDSADIEGNDGILEELSKSIHGVYGLVCNVHKYPTMHFREHYQAIRDDIFRIKQEFHPDVVYCKSPNAIHPDHQVIGEACESIFLETTIYAMEGIRDGYNQRINKWVSISAADLETKILAIMQYKSQERRSYSDADLIRAWARFRGGQVGKQYAEAFEILREIT